MYSAACSRVAWYTCAEVLDELAACHQGSMIRLKKIHACCFGVCVVWNYIKFLSRILCHFPA